MTPYQFGVKMAVAPQAISMGGDGDPPAGAAGDRISGDRVSQYMNKRGPKPPVPPKPRIAAGARNNAVSPPLNRPPVLPALNTPMLMGDAAPQYSSSAEYTPSSNLMGNVPVADIDVGPLDIPSKSVPSALASMPSTKQLMAKVQTAPRSPFNLAKTQAKPVPAPAAVQPPSPADVAKF